MCIIALFMTCFIFHMKKEQITSLIKQPSCFLTPSFAIFLSYSVMQVYSIHKAVLLNLLSVQECVRDHGIMRSSTFLSLSLFLLIVSVLIDVSGVISHFFSSLLFHSLIFS